EEGPGGEAGRSGRACREDRARDRAAPALGREDRRPVGGRNDAAQARLRVKKGDRLLFRNSQRHPWLGTAARKSSLSPFFSGRSTSAAASRGTPSRPRRRLPPSR